MHKLTLRSFLPQSVEAAARMSSSPPPPPPLQFAPFSSCVHPGFWSALADAKLGRLRLDEGPVDAAAAYSAGDPPGLPASLNLGWNALVR